MKAHELDIDSMAFAELKMRLNGDLQSTVREMQEKGLPEGIVSAKIKITMMTTVDENGEIHTSAVFEPKVTTRVGSQSEEKCGPTGGKITVMNDGSVIVGQISMDELLEKQKGA